MNHLVFLVTDSVTNSVFEGQVLLPLLQRLENNQELSITLISFETHSPAQKLLDQLNQKHSRLNCFTHKRQRFWGTWSLHSSAQFLKTILISKHNYTIIARGPLAGLIALKSAAQPPHITVQVRGLLAHEYWYLNKHTSLLLKPLYWLRTKLYQKVENQVYQTKNIHFTAVSPALKKYLQERYSIPKDMITIETNDIPKKIPLELRKTFYDEIRTKLNLKDKTIYLYAGSAHKWQSPKKVVSFFKKQLEQNPQSFLLILTKESKPFEAILQKYKIEPAHYLIMYVPHQEVQQYLCAADYGLLFREHNLLNWIARPTKALEYWAAHLPIMHNNTVHFMDVLSSKQ